MCARVNKRPVAPIVLRALSDSSAAAGAPGARAAGRGRGPGRASPAPSSSPIRSSRCTDGVRVHVQPLGRLLDAATGGEPGLERLDEAGPALRVVRQDRAERDVDVLPELLGPVLAQQQPGQPEPGGVADVAGAAQRDAARPGSAGPRRTPWAGSPRSATATPTVAVPPAGADRRRGAGGRPPSGSSPGTRTTTAPRYSPARPRWADASRAATRPAACRSMPSMAATATASGGSSTTRCRRARSRSSRSGAAPVQQVAEQLAAEPLLGLRRRCGRRSAPGR